MALGAVGQPPQRQGDRAITTEKIGTHDLAFGGLSLRTSTEWIH
jgi:hypothetical protein